MIPTEDTPDEAYWVEVSGDGRRHPYGMHKTVNLDDVEVVNCISDDDRHPKRWVIIRHGKHEAWVQVAEKDEYGYEVSQEERVSETELEAITLKQSAIRNGSDVSVGEAKALVETGDPDQIRHALVALYYVSKADPDVTDEDVDTLRELMHEHTRHVDTSHKPTLRRILDDHFGDDEDGATDN